MKHLNDEQLSARLDGELPAKSAEVAESHLAGCAACRDRLAALAGSDAVLARALDRDPGEAYFASFADRVQARLRADAATAPREAPADAAPRRSWFASPRALAWAGAAVALVAVGAFAIQFATQQAPGARRAGEPESIVGADRLEQREAAPAPAEPPASPPAPMASAARPLEAPESDGERGTFADTRERTAAGASRDAPTAAPKRNEAARKDAGSRQQLAAPQRLQELRTLPGGEQVPVQTRALPQAEKQKGFAVPPADASRPRKPLALPLTAQEQLKKSTTTQESSARERAASETRSGVVMPPTPRPSALAPATGAVTGAARVEADEAATFRLCGTVANAQGRTLAGATVTVVETGHSAVAGADGSFCVDAPSPGATLSVLALGYHEYRANVRGADAGSLYAVSLRSVETLGQGGAPAARLKTEPPPATQGRALTAPEALDRKLGDTRAMKGVLDRSGAFVIDVAQARAATTAARFAKTAQHWTTAGSLWTSVAAARLDADAVEARFNAAEARMNAWRIEPTAANRAAAAAAIAEYLAKSPAGGRRAGVEAWRRELAPR